MIFLEGSILANNDIIKEAVADGMRELMRHKTIDHISVTEICEECNLNRRTFYRYFQDKYEVVDWIYYHDTSRTHFGTGDGVSGIIGRT